MIEEPHILEWDEGLEEQARDAADEWARDAADDWWCEEINATHGEYAALLLDTGYGVDCPAGVKLTGSAAAVAHRQLRWYVHRISDLLKDPAAPAFPDHRTDGPGTDLLPHLHRAAAAAFPDHRTDEDCGYLTALELAQDLLKEARQLLNVAARTSRQLQALSWQLAYIGRRITLAAHQITTGALTQREIAAGEHLTHLTLTDTLESASHAPPRMEVMHAAVPAAHPSTAGRLQPG